MKLIDNVPQFSAFLETPMNVKQDHSVARYDGRVPKSKEIPVIRGSIDLAGNEEIRTHSCGIGQKMSIGKIIREGGQQIDFSIQGNFEQLRHVCQEWLRQLAEMESEIAAMPEEADSCAASS